MEGDSATVYLVDDEPEVLKALSRLLRAADLRVAAFDSPLAFLDACNGSTQGCVVMDLSMPGLDGLGVQQALAEKGCTLPILFLSAHADVPQSVRAMKQGALDFMTKPVEAGVLLEAVHAAISRDHAARTDQETLDEIRSRLATLTPREREVFQLVISGQLNKQIAADLGTVEKTVKVHRGRVMEKLKARSLADLVRMAERLGIVPASRGR
jgi:FixJ family two-component response regulator